MRLNMKMLFVLLCLLVKDFQVGLLGLVGMRRDQPELWAFFGVNKLSPQHINPSLIVDSGRRWKAADYV